MADNYSLHAGYKPKRKNFHMVISRNFEEIFPRVIAKGLRRAALILHLIRKSLKSYRNHFTYGTVVTCLLNFASGLLRNTEEMFHR